MSQPEIIGQPKPPPADEISNTSPLEAAKHDPYSALRFSSYRLFIMGFFISVIGMQMQAVAAQYEVYQKTGSAMSLGWVGLALALPMLILTLPAGHLADVRSRRRIMIVTQVISAICSLGLAWLSHYRPGWHYSVAGMYLLLGLGAAGATLGRPARAALMPQLVPAPIFPNAAAWNASFFESASVLGPAIGGFICARSIALTYLISAAFFLGCTLLIWRLPEYTLAVPETEQKRKALDELSAGLSFVWRTKLMLGAMTLDLFAVLLGGSVYLLPIYAEQVLHVGATGFGWLRAAPSIGAISVAMFQAHRPPLRNAGKALLWAVAGFGGAWIVFGLSRSYWLSFLMLVLTGAFDNISVVVRHTLMQMLTPEAMRGRVSAVGQIFIGSSNELGGFESGATAAWLGPEKAVILGGIGTIVAVIATTIGFPQVRRLGSLLSIRPQTIAPSQGFPFELDGGQTNPELDKC